MAYVKNHTSELNRNLAASINQNLGHVSQSTLGSSIFKVPQKLRHRNENVYTPNIVSIGPFHHGTDSHRLAPMENIKRQYLSSLLERLSHSERSDIVLECIVGDIREFQKYARECYADPLDIGDEKFIEMLVVDGLFLIELFRKDAGLVSIDTDDPIFNTSWMRENLYHDLILLENQIPWFILQRLFKLTIGVSEQEPNFLAIALVLRFFETKMLMAVPAEYSLILNKEKKAEYDLDDFKIKHLLDLLRSCLLSSSVDSKPKRTNLKLFPPVTDLIEAGVKLSKGNPDDILNIEFSKGEGILKIPPIKIGGNSESLFRNLIAYEQCDRHCTDQFTSYAAFMDCLINSSKDAEVLCDKEIVEHTLSTEDISLLFHRLYNDTLISKFHYGETAHEINNYYKSKWPRWRATLMRDYFNNPWSIVSFIAAIFILGFTFTQTVYTMLSYYQ